MPRLSIPAKILLLAPLNILVLAVVFFLFARAQFRFNLSSFLLAPGRERILSVSRLAALQLPETPRQDWTKLLAEYSTKYPAQFYLYSEGGTELAGDKVNLPTAVLETAREHPIHHMDVEGPGSLRPLPPPPDDRGGPPPGRRSFAEGPRPGFMAGGPVHLIKTTEPASYWAGIRIPLWTAEDQEPIRAVLVWRFHSLWTEPFFFDYKPWLAIISIVLLVSGACWLPFVRGLTRAISNLTAATRRIADGHFDVKLPATRRDELGRLSDSINRMSERLAGYVYGQKRFLGDIAHELSSPIARMQMALGILEQRATEEDAAYVIDVREEVEHMSTLVNELLSFSKAQIGDQNPELQSVNIAEIVQRVVQREKSSDTTIRTEISSGLQAWANPECLSRGLANVLRNAIRYAGHAGPVEISADRMLEGVCIKVSDHGPGIPEPELENVFRPFYRPEFARQRETGGTGLGLAIVRDCIESCGGRVECRNRSPHGLEVTIELPH